MNFLSSLLARLTGGSSSANDLHLEIVKFDPPNGSTLMAGEEVKITVAWRHSIRGRGVGIWTKPELPPGVGGGYEGDSGEAHRPGRGRVLRGVMVGDPTVLESIALVASDGDSRELFRQRIPVNFTFVANPEREARRHDGAFSRITHVEVRAPAEGRLPLGSHVDVQVGYFAQSTHGIRVVAIPVTDLYMRFVGSVKVVNGEGEAVQGFVIGEAGVVNQVHVRLLNDSDVAVDEQWVDCHVEFGA